MKRDGSEPVATMSCERAGLETFSARAEGAESEGAKRVEEEELGGGANETAGTDEAEGFEGYTSTLTIHTVAMVAAGAHQSKK